MNDIVHSLIVGAATSTYGVYGDTRMPEWPLLACMQVRSRQAGDSSAQTAADSVQLKTQALQALWDCQNLPGLHGLHKGACGPFGAWSWLKCWLLHGFASV